MIVPIDARINLFGLGLFAGMLVFMEIGRQIGRFRARQESADPGGWFSAMEGSVFGLMGLLIAFTFSAAASRYEMRRQLVVDESNDIGTAWMRLALLPPAQQTALRGHFRQYVDSRLEFYREFAEAEPVTPAMSRARTLQDEIWMQSVAACDALGSPSTTSLVLASINNMIDITTTRSILAQTHLPQVILILLIVLPLVCALLAGLNAAAVPRRDWVRMLAFALTVSLTVFVIIDVDYPRLGLVRIDQFDRVLVDLRNGMRE